MGNKLREMKIWKQTDDFEGKEKDNSNQTSVGLLLNHESKWDNFATKDKKSWY